MTAKAIGVCMLVAVFAAAGQDVPELAAVRSQLDAQSAQMQAMAARIEALEKLVARLAGSEEKKPAAAPAPAPEAKSAEARTRLHISGYADFTSIYRSTFTGNGISTGFGTIPLEGTAEGRLGEFRESAAHSKLSFRLDTRLGGRDLTTFVETDFLAAPQGNPFAGSNAHPLRMRLYWAQWRGAKWELLGGQSWSLLAPNRQGISPHPADIMSTQLIDPNYSVGLVWTRQATVRVTRRWQRFTAAAALEDPEQIILDPRQAPADARGLGQRGTPGANQAPDVVIKVAYDAKAAHLEAAAIGRSFRVYAANRTQQASGGGVMLAGVAHAGRRLDVVSQNFLSAGGGRYVQVMPDVVVRPDGKLVRVFTASVLEGIELKLPQGLQAYGYYGLVYGRRAAYPGAGFGALTGSTVDNRTVAQTTIGFRHTFWREEGRGALSYAINYSYLNRKLWDMTTAGARGQTHMVYTSFRYNLP